MSVRPEVDDVIAFLNELVEKDRAFMSALITHWIPCNEDIADHPTVQVFRNNGQAFAGLLGVLNGFMGIIDTGKKSGWGPITVICDDTGRIDKFVRTEEG